MDPVEEVGGVMTLAVRWPGRATASGLPLADN